MNRVSRSRLSTIGYHRARQPRGVAGGQPAASRRRPDGPRSQRSRRRRLRRARREVGELAARDWPKPATSSSPACPRQRSPPRSSKGADGVLEGLGPGKVWLEMSTTDAAEIRRLAAAVEARGARAMDCPVSGGCHRAATGNISIFAGGSRATFERALPVLSILGHQILHTGEIGSASMLKVLTNYLCTVHLVALAEALTTCQGRGSRHEHDLRGHPHLVGQLVRARDGVAGHPERQPRHRLHHGPGDQGRGAVRPAGDRSRACRSSCRRWSSKSSRTASARYGPREHSPNIIRRYEEACGVKVLGTGFPATMVDHTPKEPGFEVVPSNRSE